MKDWLRLSFLLGCVLLGGCSHEEPGAIVRGKVIYKGAPLDKGTIVFRSAGGGEMSYGSVQKDGTFKLLNQLKTERIEPGQYVAVIFADNSSIAAMKEDPLYPIQPTVPFKFSSPSTSPLKYDIVLGENDLEIDLDKFK